MSTFRCLLTTLLRLCRIVTSRSRIHRKAMRQTPAPILATPNRENSRRASKKKETILAATESEQKSTRFTTEVTATNTFIGHGNIAKSEPDNACNQGVMARPNPKKFEAIWVTGPGHTPDINSAALTGKPIFIPFLERLVRASNQRGNEARKRRFHFPKHPISEGRNENICRQTSSSKMQL
jgi:hypothetical protein